MSYRAGPAIILVEPATVVRISEQQHCDGKFLGCPELRIVNPRDWLAQRKGQKCLCESGSMSIDKRTGFCIRRRSLVGAQSGLCDRPRALGRHVRVQSSD